MGPLYYYLCSSYRRSSVRAISKVVGSGVIAARKSQPRFDDAHGGWSEQPLHAQAERGGFARDREYRYATVMRRELSRGQQCGRQRFTSNARSNRAIIRAFFEQAAQLPQQPLEAWNEPQELTRDFERHQQCEVEVPNMAEFVLNHGLALLGRQTIIQCCREHHIWPKKSAGKRYTAHVGRGVHAHAAPPE